MKILRSERKEIAVERARAFFDTLSTELEKVKGDLSILNSLSSIFGCSERIARARLAKYAIYLGGNYRDKGLINCVGRFHMQVVKSGPYTYTINMSDDTWKSVVDIVLQLIRTELTILNRRDYSVTVKVLTNSSTLDKVAQSAFNKMVQGRSACVAEIAALDSEIQKLTRKKLLVEEKVKKFERLLDDEDLLFQHIIESLS